MQGNIERFLQPVFDLSESNRNKQAALKNLHAIGGFSKSFTKHDAEPEGIMMPNELSGKEFLSFLLNVNAEIEHGLMVQYLYAAYSLGGETVPEKYRELVRSWQEIILGIAKEEMGHLVSCQNILKLIGAPLNLGRDDYPWDTHFYPFPFTLEPISLDSLAKYVYAESPEGWIDSDDPIAAEVKLKVGNATHDPHRVGALFEKMMSLINSRELLPDEIFQHKTYPYQAKFDEWGRGYAGGARGNSTHGNPKGSPDVLVMPLISRDDAKKALEAISEQGEASSGQVVSPSHFERFHEIYVELKAALSGTESWSPSRNLAVNPYLGYHEEKRVVPKIKSAVSAVLKTAITHPLAVRWAELFNLRYRMLLNYLSHSFQIDDSEAHGVKTARGTIITATFGEMYNLRSISTRLIKLPANETGDLMAGPPFMIPYTLNLPAGEYNKWSLHADLLTTSRRISNQILSLDDPEGQLYLNGLIQADQKLLQQIEEILLTLKP